MCHLDETPLFNKSMLNYWKFFYLQFFSTIGKKVLAKEIFDTDYPFSSLVLPGRHSNVIERYQPEANLN